MKFSYTLLKQLVPAIKSKQELAELLALHVFEVESIDGDTIDIKILSNRYSDAASHIGIARELAATLGVKFKESKPKSAKWRKAEGALDLILSVEERKLCPRYMARYFEIDEMGSSPEWMQKVLHDCGMRPINAVVDIMNYVMLEVGQPMHAFDAVKLKSITVRRAKPNEKIQTLDGGAFELSQEDLIIADHDHPLAIAGIKGGTKAEVAASTRRIIVESANFDNIAIYKTSKRLKLQTDASSRFSHELSPALSSAGLERATELLVEICGARVGEVVDFYPKKWKPAVLKFALDEFQKISGLHISFPLALGYLKRLGFQVSGAKVTAPDDRTDIALHEDLVDEIVRLYGYDKLTSIPPHASLKPSEHEPLVDFKDSIRSLLVGLGMSEAYNYSFVSGKAAEDTSEQNEKIFLQNSISVEFACLRPTLKTHLLKNLEDNYRYTSDVRLFEIGKVFSRRKSDHEIEERTMLGIVLGYVKQSSAFLELKGIVSTLLERLGLVDYILEPQKSRESMSAPDILRVESDHHVLGYINLLHGVAYKDAAIAELDVQKILQLVNEEREYEPLPKYPSVMRDISMIVDQGVRVGDILRFIQGMSPKNIYDVDLIDYYEDNSKMNVNEKSLTFRIVFQSDDRTLTDEEVGKDMEKIVSMLKDQFSAEIR